MQTVVKVWIDPGISVMIDLRLSRRCLLIICAKHQKNRSIKQIDKNYQAKQKDQQKTQGVYRVPAVLGKFI